MNRSHRSSCQIAAAIPASHSWPWQHHILAGVMLVQRAVVIVLVLVLGTAACGQQADWARARRQLVDQTIVGGGITNQRVIAAMLKTPRHEFVSSRLRSQAYFDMSLPIGEHQTISSPFIVAFMTEALDPQPADKVLEIGTGSGYQAAVLSPLVRDVYTIEIVESLARRAQATLKRLKYSNVHVKTGDGYLGWPEFAPYDRIIVTCSPEDVPQPLVDQLADGGRMIIPVGERYQQVLYVFRKSGDELQREPLRTTLFVPMTGQAEQARHVQPDGTKPAIVDGSFEDPGLSGAELGGWFYQQQVTRSETSDARSGKACAKFENETPGRSSHALQGFALDGRAVSELQLSAVVKTVNVKDGPAKDMAAAIVVSFYDDQRSPLGQNWLGPWRGSESWHSVSKTFRVPGRTREAILRIGLFGATGQLWVDNVSVSGGAAEPAAKAPNEKSTETKSLPDTSSFD